MSTAPNQHDAHHEQAPPLPRNNPSRLRKAALPAGMTALGLALMAFGPTLLSDSNGNGKDVNIKINVSPTVPKDIFTNGDSASKATLTQAAIFAWEEFIALNWPAQTGYRDSANAGATFGNNPVNGPLVWHTFRHKVEIFPGNSMAPHGYNASSPDYGYNDGFVPKYFYNPAQTNTSDGQVAPLSGVPSATTPWINLDETSEIGVANMYTGATDTSDNGNMMLYMAKANKKEYVYAARQQWFSDNASLKTAKQKTITYINANSNTPQPSAGDTLVSMPYGTIEVKTAWRKLSGSELTSGRFYTNKVRRYVQRNDTIFYKDDVYGMTALHIIQKTPTAPYFIFATFEQADNILTAGGQPLEDVNGAIINPGAGLGPDYNVRNSNGPRPMRFTATDKRLYYINALATDGSGNPLPDSLQLPQGKTHINQRLNTIPADIIKVNKAAHKAINTYNKGTVWQYYKLINVQYRPMNKPTPGTDYHGADSATYYQANSVVESDYILQKFSGRFYTTTLNGQPVYPNSITDFEPAPGYAVVHNAYNNGKYLMGGCMGCHGNATNGGTDYSFIFGSAVTAPSPARQVTTKEANLRFLQLFHPNGK